MGDVSFRVLFQKGWTFQALEKALVRRKESSPSYSNLLERKKNDCNKWAMLLRLDFDAVLLLKEASTGL